MNRNVLLMGNKNLTLNIINIFILQISHLPTNNYYRNDPCLRREWILNTVQRTGMDIN